jgi:GH15 family glucan-1,4-alpha-glucosidase
MERIADYALLSNCQASGLVSRAGSIDWACLPAFDSPALFARILGEPGGFWSIRPTQPVESTRAYVEDTMVLRTEMRTSTGVVALTDFLPLHPDDMHNDIGRRSPAAVHRIVEGVDGEVEVDIEIAVRPEYGLTTPLLHETEPGVWVTRGGPVTVTTITDVTLQPMDGVLTGRTTVRAGDRAGFALCVSDPWRGPWPSTSSSRSRTPSSAGGPGPRSSSGTTASTAISCVAVLWCSGR